MTVSEDTTIRIVSKLEKFLEYAGNPTFNITVTEAENPEDSCIIMYGNFGRGKNKCTTFHCQSGFDYDKLGKWQHIGNVLELPQDHKFYRNIHPDQPFPVEDLKEWAVDVGDRLKEMGYQVEVKLNKIETKQEFPYMPPY